MSTSAQFQTLGMTGIRLALFVVLLPGLSGRTLALNDYPTNTLWITDGRVNAVARSADRIYLGGTFNTVAPFSGSALLLDTATGTPDLRLTRIKGGAGGTTVRAAIADGAGGWYLGGNFEFADDTPFQGLVHILPDGRPDPAFSFSITFGSNGPGIVRSLALAATIAAMVRRDSALSSIPSKCAANWLIFSSSQSNSDATALISNEARSRWWARVRRSSTKAMRWSVVRCALGTAKRCMWPPSMGNTPMACAMCRLLGLKCAETSVGMVARSRSPILS